MLNDSIAAISTAPGEGAISIVRVSGKDAIPLVDKIFVSRSGARLADIPGHTLTLGWLKGVEEELIDEVLIGLMRGPRSYTGEDVVEINCHGGALAARRCLARVIKLGARPAEPGEFTKRAFLNGRLDISQAEAVIDIIRARSNRALELSVRNLQGAFSQLVQTVEDLLVTVNSRIEASINFPEEVGEQRAEELVELLNQALVKVDGLLKAGRRNKVYRDGLRIVIAGKPNVGKSSLMNALVQKDRAIVTDIPGTTRDVIEDFINLNGIPVKLWDTAGIRETRDVIEQIGVEKTRETISGADLVIFMLDAGIGIGDEDKEVWKLIEEKRKIIVINKQDVEEKKVDAKEAMNNFPGSQVLGISARNETGIAELEEFIISMAINGGAPGLSEDIMVNVRQEERLKEIRRYIEDALEGFKVKSPWDCIAVDTWGAVEGLEELTGKRIKEAVVERIFADFCIGK